MPATHNQEFILKFDGSCNPNVSSGAAAVCFYKNKDGIVTKVWEESCYLGSTSTSNGSEYHGLLIGLRRVLRDFGCILDRLTLSIYSDSQLVVGQVNGDTRVEHPNMILYYNIIMNILSKFPNPPTLAYCPREENTVADALAKEAMRSFYRKNEEPQRFTYDPNFKDADFKSSVVADYRRAIYYPNLCNTVKIKTSSGQIILGSQDLGASVPDQFVMFDAQTLLRDRPELFARMEDPHPISFVTGRAQFAVVGRLQSINIWFHVKGLTNFCETIADNALVVQGLPVPIHLGSMGSRIPEGTSFLVGGSDSLRLSRDLFPPEFRNNQFWDVLY